MEGIWWIKMENSKEIETYNLETQPLIPYYEERDILFNVNGMQEIDKVSEDIKKVIGVFWILTCMKAWL